MFWTMKYVETKEIQIPYLSMFERHFFNFINVISLQMDIKTHIQDAAKHAMLLKF